MTRTIPPTSNRVLLLPLVLELSVDALGAGELATPASDAPGEAAADGAVEAVADGAGAGGAVGEAWPAVPWAKNGSPPCSGESGHPPNLSVRHADSAAS